MNTLPSIENDFPAWYAEVVRRAGLAENAAVRGMMVIKPYGYAIWELLQRQMDDRIKATGHENFYFPMLIPGIGAGEGGRPGRGIRARGGRGDRGRRLEA